MAKLVEQEAPRFLDPETLEAQVSEYAKLKASMEVLETRSKQLREKLADYAKELGYTVGGSK